MKEEFNKFLIKGKGHHDPLPLKYQNHKRKIVGWSFRGRKRSSRAKSLLIRSAKKADLRASFKLNHLLK
jgi:hypothetical protein